jgi:signal transduction histidine kinase
MNVDQNRNPEGRDSVNSLPDDTASLMHVLFNKSPDAIVVCSKDGWIRMANPAAGVLFKSTVNEMHQRNIRDFESERDGDAPITTTFLASTESDAPWECEHVFVGGDGMPFLVNARMHSVNLSGSDLCLLIIRDNPTSPAREADLRQNSRMQAIGQLAGGIAHDFNNILGGISGYAELAIEDASENQIQRENLEKLLSAAERAKKLVKQIVTFSRPSTLRRDVVAMPKLLEETVAFLRSSVPCTIKIEYNVTNNVLAVAGDGAKIQEMLFNLATNAVAAMTEDGSEDGILRISLGAIQTDVPVRGVVGESPAGQYAVVTMSDNGSGIEPSILPLIFEPFFTTRHPDEGVGMGLPVVFGVVRSHGGNIRIESTVGEGTEVRVYLPAVPIRTISSPAPYISEPGGIETILVVDDEPLLVDIYKKFLKLMGYDVIAVMDPTEALDIIQDASIHIDALLTDQTMPQMTGMELASRAMALRPGLPVVLCTGFSKTVDEESALARGISGFIQKPVRKKELAKALRKALERA